MNARRFILPLAALLFLAGAFMAWRDWPRLTPIAEGYVLSDFPTSGLRYVIDGGGQKKVGEQVIAHRVEGRRILGMVRRSMESPETVGFALDMASGQVVYQAVGDAPVMPPR